MRTMTAEGSVTRTELALSNLEFGTLTQDGASGFYIVRNGFGPGSVSKRRITAESIFYPGRTLVHATPDVQTSILKIRVKGETQQDLYNRVAEVTAAFDQFSYSLTVNINGTYWEYECETADWTLGQDGAVDDIMLRSNTQFVTFTIPHAPGGAAGFTDSTTYPIIE